MSPWTDWVKECGTPTFTLLQAGVPQLCHSADEADVLPSLSVAYAAAAMHRKSVQMPSSLFLDQKKFARHTWVHRNA